MLKFFQRFRFMKFETTEDAREYSAQNPDLIIFYGTER